MIATNVDALKQMKIEILRKAKEEADEILRKAKEEADEIIEKAYRETGDAKERIREEAEPELEKVRRRILWGSIIENRKKLVNVRDELISQAFKRAERKIVQMGTRRDENYEELLLDLIVEGAKSIGDQKIRVTSNSRDMKFLKKHITVLRERLKKGLGSDVEVEFFDDPLACIGGIVVASMDQKLIYYNTLEARLFKARETLRLKVAQILFE